MQPLKGKKKKTANQTNWNETKKKAWKRVRIKYNNKLATGDTLPRRDIRRIGAQRQEAQNNIEKYHGGEDSEGRGREWES